MHLLATSYARAVPPGKQLGKMIFYYADGTMRERPIIQGSDVGHLRYWPQDAPLTGNAQIVATTTNGLTAEQGVKFRLFKVTWENPFPDLVVKSLDVVCETRPGDLNVFAITVEP